MWIKWFIIIMAFAMIFIMVIGFVKQIPIREKLDLMLNLIWYPIGIFSALAFIAIWFDWDLYKELGANMEYKSDKWILLISGALFVRSGMHVIDSWIPNLKYYSTLETLAMFLMALGVFNLGSVTLNAGNVAKTIGEIVDVSPSPSPSPSVRVNNRTTTTVRVGKAQVYRDSNGRVKNGYLLKNQKVVILGAANGYKKINYNGRVYWIQANHLN